MAFNLDSSVGSCQLVLYIGAVGQRLKLAVLLERYESVAAPDAALLETPKGHRHIGSANPMDVNENRPSFDPPRNFEPVVDVVGPYGGR